MTEKRYYVDKHLLKQDTVHDTICHRFMSIEETVEHMNMDYEKYSALKKENQDLKDCLVLGEDTCRCVNKENARLEKENEQLKCIIKQLERKYEDKGFFIGL